MNGKALEEVGQFKYLGSLQTPDGTAATEVEIELATTHLHGEKDSFAAKIKLYKTLKLWEKKYCRSMLGLSYRERKTSYST